MNLALRALLALCGERPGGPEFEDRTMKTIIAGTRTVANLALVAEAINPTTSFND